MILDKLPGKSPHHQAIERTASRRVPIEKLRYGMIELDPIACSDGRVGNSDTGPVLSLQILFRQSSLEHGVMYLRLAKNGD